MTRSLPALALLALTACGSAIQPLPGTYTIRTAEAGTDTCDLAEEVDLVGESFSLTVNDDQIEAAIGDDRSVTFDCLMDGDEMLCDPFTQVQDVGGDESDAVVTIAWDLGGTFADESTVEAGELGLDYSCAGADCAAFGDDAGISLPCQTVFAITASL